MGHVPPAGRSALDNRSQCLAMSAPARPHGVSSALNHKGHPDIYGGHEGRVSWNTPAGGELIRLR
jgi:hypothetical protein